jgi:putative sporulation protein YyaC
MEYSFHVYNKLAADGVAMASDKLLQADLAKKANKTRGAGMRSTQTTPLIAPPVILCIGSDLAIGDSLGPITGSMLKFKTQGLKTFVYGTLASPVTAKEIRYMRTFLRETHKDSQVIAIDAAVGNEGDIGLVKLNDIPLHPGAGANKRLGALGDISVMGVVAEKSISNYALLNTTRLNLVYTMAEIISDGIAALLWERCSRTAKNA